MAGFTKAEGLMTMSARLGGGCVVRDRKDAGRTISLPSVREVVVRTITLPYPPWSDRPCSTGATDLPWKTFRLRQNASNSHQWDIIFRLNS